MRKTTLAITQTRIGKHKYFCVTCPKLGGGRRRRFFKDRREAQTFFELARIEQQNNGLAAFSLSESLRIEALQCHEKLAAIGFTIRDATEHFLRFQKDSLRSCTVSAAVDELLAARKGDGCSPRYIGDLRVRLGRFAAAFGNQSITILQAREIDDWLRKLPVGGVTRNSYRRRLSSLFGFAKKRGYAADNPLRDVERAKEKPAPVGILTVDETRRLLANAQPTMLPFWAIGAFAGLRTAEIQRLNWDEIDLERGFISVSAAKSKTASRRLVTIQSNLREWLTCYSERTGPVTPGNFQSRANSDRERARLDDRWPTNALRHSFASYHLAEFCDAAKLALEMGNSPRMIFKHYREIVRPTEAAAYWRITPRSARSQTE